MSDRACPTCGTDLPVDAPEALCPRCLLRVALDANHSPNPAAFVPPSPKDLAPHFPHLEIQGLIGHGGMGAVYKARQIKLDRLVALKVLPRQAGSDPAFAERFVREARALARLQHPNVVAIHDFGEAGGYYYLLMEYVDGTDLRRLMRSGPLTPERALEILTAVCEALQYAHQNEVVHRDIKPENVLIDRLGRVKLADFGLAKLVNFDPAALTLTGAHQAMGTPHYMAPEQLERPLEVDHRADLYSLGVLAYELLAGELPLGRFDPPSKRSPGPTNLDAVVLKALERDPARRYQHAGEMLAALRDRSAQVAPPDAEEEEEEYDEESEPMMDPVNEFLTFLGLVLGAAAVVVGIAVTRSGWFAFGLLAVERVANYVNWRQERRGLVGMTLVIAGIAASIALLLCDRSMWWIVLLIWFWYGDHVYKFFKGINPHADEDAEEEEEEEEEEVAEKITDWHDLTEQEQQVLREIYAADSEGLVTYPVDMEGEDLAALREGNELLPEERVLAMVPLADFSNTIALIFGSQHIYFPALQHGEEIRCSLAYETLSKRSFINHGTGVYCGDGITLKPENDTSCEALTALLNAARRAVQAEETDEESS